MRRLRKRQSLPSPTLHRTSSWTPQQRHHRTAQTAQHLPDHTNTTSRPLGSLEFDELRQFLRLDDPSPTAAPPSSSTANPTLPASNSVPSTLDSGSLSTAELDLDAELAALSLSHAEVQELLASSAPAPLPAHGQANSVHSSIYTPGTQPLRIVRTKWERPIAAPPSNVLEGVDDLSEEEARQLAKELGLEGDEIDLALRENSRKPLVPLGPSPDEVPLLAQSLKGTGAGPLVDEAEFKPPPSDGPAATKGQLSPAAVAPVPLDPEPTPDPVAHDPTDLPREVVAEALEVPGAAPVLDEAEFAAPPSSEDGPGPATGQLASPRKAVPKDEVISLAAISPVPVQPQTLESVPSQIEDLPAANEAAPKAEK